MNSNAQWYGNLNIPNALRRAHDDVRSALLHAMNQHGPIVEAARYLSRLCLPHFEWEERTVFPILELLPDVTQGNVRPEMVEVLPMIADFHVRHEKIDNDHRSILAGIVTLLQAARPENDKELAEIAYALRLHEKIEEEVVHPTVFLIGEYLHQKLTMH